MADFQPPANPAISPLSARPRELPAPEIPIPKEVQPLPIAGYVHLPPSCHFPATSRYPPSASNCNIHMLVAHRTSANPPIDATITALPNQHLLRCRLSTGRRYSLSDIAYNFTHDNKIKRIYVSAAVQTHLVAGRLMIVCQGDANELVPRVIADKIAERDASLVVQVNKTCTEVDADDPYAAFQIPDDLMW